MEITIYRRHSAQCKQNDDRYHPRCGCSLWFQFNWTQPETTLDGNNLHRGQNKWSADTRIWSEAQTNAKRVLRDFELRRQAGSVAEPAQKVDQMTGTHATT